MSQTLEIQIFEEIGGWGFGMRDLVEQLRGFTGTNIRVPINSYGGVVTEGISIYNVLKGRKEHVEAHIVGYAMSMGTVIAMAADTVTMPENGYFMIHEPWGVEVGDAEEMEKMSSLLEKMAEMLAKIYSEKTGLTVNRVRKMMKEETWLTAKEAKALGFVDKLTKGAEITAAYHVQNQEILAACNKLPKPIYNSLKSTEMENTFLNKIGKILGLVGEGTEPITEDQAEAKLQELVEQAQASTQNTEELSKFQNNVKDLFGKMNEEFGTKLKAVQDELSEVKAAADKFKESNDELTTNYNALQEELKELKGQASGGQTKGDGAPPARKTGAAAEGGATVIAASMIDEMLGSDVKIVRPGA